MFVFLQIPRYLESHRPASFCWGKKKNAAEIPPIRACEVIGGLLPFLDLQGRCPSHPVSQVRRERGSSARNRKRLYRRHDRVVRLADPNRRPSTPMHFYPYATQTPGHHNATSQYDSCPAPPPTPTSFSVPPLPRRTSSISWPSYASPAIRTPLSPRSPRRIYTWPWA